MKRYIVWNEDKTEGFVTDDKKDALMVFMGNFSSPYTSAGKAFYDCYEDQDLSLQEIEIKEN